MIAYVLSNFNKKNKLTYKWSTPPSAIKSFNIWPEYKCPPLLLLQKKEKKWKRENGKRKEKRGKFSEADNERVGPKGEKTPRWMVTFFSFFSFFVVSQYSLWSPIPLSIFAPASFSLLPHLVFQIREFRSYKQRDVTAYHQLTFPTTIRWKELFRFQIVLFILLIDF